MHNSDITLPIIFLHYFFRQEPPPLTVPRRISALVEFPWLPLRVQKLEHLVHVHVLSFRGSLPRPAVPYPRPVLPLGWYLSISGYGRQL